MTIGHKSDDDVIYMICPQCGKLLVDSDRRKMKVKNWIPVFLVILILVGFYSYAIYSNRLDLNSSRLFSESNVGLATQETEDSIEAKQTVEQFFKFLNQDNFAEAYNLTNNDLWSPFSVFKSNQSGWGKINNVKINSITSKYYYSIFGAEKIYNVDYTAIFIRTNRSRTFNYDFHLRKENDKWKIVRMIYAKDPNSNVLKNDEVPQTAEEAVTRFLEFIDKGKFEKAYLLTNNPGWGSESEFLSKDKGWGCISKINIHEINPADEKYSFGKDAIYANYYAEDTCNGSHKFEFIFHLDNNDQYWKIVKVTLP